MIEKYNTNIINYHTDTERIFLLFKEYFLLRDLLLCCYEKGNFSERPLPSNMGYMTILNFEFFGTEC